MSDALITAISELNEAQVLQLVQERLAAGTDPQAILTNCRDGMAEVGKRYEAGEYYVSELIMAGEMFKQANALLAPHFASGDGATKGKVVVGTVKGDIHDIGKDLVVGMLRAGGFEVIDLGVDVPVEKFIQAVKDSGAKVVGLSGLITLSFELDEGDRGGAGSGGVALAGEGDGGGRLADREGARVRGSGCPGKRRPGGR